jgi:hypothetical protein
MTESVGSLLDTVGATRRRLAAVSVAGTPRATQAACDLGRSLSMELAGLLEDIGAESPAAQATARAAGERFDSHVLAATMLEASDASPSSVFELVGRGLDRLTADLQRLARARRLPA